MSPTTPSGPSCPHCGAEHTVLKSQYRSRQKYQCNACGRWHKPSPEAHETDALTGSTLTGGKATIHIIYQRAKDYTIGEKIELKSGGYVVTGRVVAV